MRKKYGRFYADWRDQHGKRKMKSFPTKNGALRHQNKMRAAAAAKKARASAASPKSAKPGPRHNHAAGKAPAAA